MREQLLAGFAGLAIASGAAWAGLYQDEPCGGCGADERCVGGACVPETSLAPCTGGEDCGYGEACVRGRCVTAPRCGDGACDLAAGECAERCRADCPDVPCRSDVCDLDGQCSPIEGPSCPDCFPGGCDFDGACSLGESARCPDCSCGDAFCDTAAGECEQTCPRDCAGHPCTDACDFDAACDEGEAKGCPDCSCGDDLCEPFEDCESCALDCSPCAGRCGDGICQPGESPDCADCLRGW